MPLLSGGWPWPRAHTPGVVPTVASSEIDAGTAYRFVLYHVMQDAPLADIFQVTSIDVGGATLH